MNHPTQAALDSRPPQNSTSLRPVDHRFAMICSRRDDRVGEIKTHSSQQRA
jgi:hypothetical protein